MALEAAFPDVVIETLVLGVPKVGPEVEAHLTEQRGETAVAVLDVLVGGKVHEAYAPPAFRRPRPRPGRFASADFAGYLPRAGPWWAGHDDQISTPAPAC